MNKFLLVICTFFLFSKSFSQSVNFDSATSLQVKNAVDAYDHFTDGNAAIYNGQEYIYYSFLMEGDPYFITGNLTIGWVKYKNRMYDSLLMLYDVARNMVVIASQYNLKKIALENDFIDSFHLSGHTFIALKEDHQQNLYNSGYYDLLYNGHVQLLARRIKTLNPTIKGSAVVTVFLTKDHFYIFKDGIYYLVSNKKDVFKVFQDKNHELKKRLRKEHLKFRRKTFENTLVQSVAFYDQLTH